MKFNWKELLGFVENLYENANDLPCKEGVYRTIVNRAYFSALNTAAAFIRDVVGEGLPNDHTYHEKVNKYFEDDEALHRLLDELRQKRKSADYDPRSQGFEHKAYVSIMELKEFIGFPRFQNVFSEGFE